MCDSDNDSGVWRNGEEIHSAEMFGVCPFCAKGADPGVAVAGVLEL